jgi:hypothetical protein
MQKPYRILSLDGGGSWALIQVRALQRLFADRPQLRGHALLSEFDLVAANSGGSLTLAGLLMDYTLGELLALFMDESRRRQVFVPNARLWRMVYRLIGIGPRYHTPEKLRGIRAVLGETGRQTLQELQAGLRVPVGGRRPHLMICGFDYAARRGVFFRSNDHSRAQTHGLAELAGVPGMPRQTEYITLAEAVHASTNAPVNFFNRPARIQITCDGETQYRLFWDGAVGGYNNPVLAAVTESLCNGVPAAAIHVLSLGTSSEFLPGAGDLPAASPELVRPRSDLRDRNRGLPGFLEDLQKLSTSILSDPPDAASFVAYTMLFQDALAQQTLRAAHPRFIRLNPLIQPVLSPDGKRWELPRGFSADQFRQLKRLQLDAVGQRDVEAIDAFAEAWLLDHVPNQPIRWGYRLRPILGQGWFSEGLAAWQSWFQ